MIVRVEKRHLTKDFGRFSIPLLYLMASLLGFLTYHSRARLFTIVILIRCLKVNVQRLAQVHRNGNSIALLGAS